MTDLSKIDTTIHLFGIAIHQPVGVFTDFINAALCLYFYLVLQRMSGTSNSTRYWALFYLNICIATFLGGYAHGAYLTHEGIGFKSLWLTMHVFNGLSVYAAQHATLNSALQFSKNKNFWKQSYKLQLLLFIPAVFIFQNFLVVIIDMAIGLIPIMFIHFKDIKNEKSSKWIAYGILISFLTAFIHLSKFSLHVYFNHLDIAHVFIAINLSVMFIGVERKAISSVSI
jgi:hypothetical protein